MIWIIDIVFTYDSSSWISRESNPDFYPAEVAHAHYVRDPTFHVKGRETHGGAGGSRTLVQTDSRGAFYALSRLLVVGQGPENGTQTLSYPLYLVAPPGKWNNQPKIASAL